MKIKLDDLVKVIKQPENISYPVVGKVGIVFDIYDSESGKTAYIFAFTKEGVAEGAGSIPVKCLSLEKDPEWDKAKDLYNRIVLKYERKIIELSEKYNIKPEEVQSIFDELSLLTESMPIDAAINKNEMN